MIRFHTLTLRNFLSYGNNTTIFELERPGTTLIVGEDLDKTAEGIGANGVGKSALINALTYAIYDKPISKISKDNLVNNINGKNMVVTLEFSTGDGNLYKIIRERKTKAGAAGNNTYFYVNGEDKTVDSAGTNKLIENTIGIPYELFVRIVVFSASHTPFLDLPQTHATAPNQKDIIEELFGLTELSAKAELLKKETKDWELSLQMKKEKVALLEKEHARHLTLVESAKARVASWIRQNTEQIENLKDKLNRVEQIDFDVERALHTELSALTEERNTFSEQLKADQRLMKELMKQYQDNESQLSHLRDAKCPYCLQDYAEAAGKIDGLIAENDSLFTKIEELQPLIEKAAERLEELRAKISEVREKVTVHDLEELQNIKNQTENIRAKIVEQENAINPFVEPYEELLNAELEPINYDEVNTATREIEHQKFLLKLLTKKDSFVRKELLNQKLPVLNKNLRENLSQLGLPHVVEFTHEMTAKISQFGRELDFGNLSAGQRARVNIALSLAFKDVRERMSNRVNVCMLDEVLDHGLDAVGVQAAAKLLKLKAQTDGLSMYIVSHRDEVGSIFKNTLKIQMEKGFSYIKDEQGEQDDAERN